MRTIYCLMAALMATAWFQVAIADQTSESKYSGQETRLIKSLSSDDISELERGGGWGLAKAAELNGLPGPAHLLELKNDIGLTRDQLEAIQRLHEEMKSQAIEHGKQLIELEAELETRFQTELPTDAELKAMLLAIAQTRAQLRFIHLSTHLKTPSILTKQQIDAYNQLRGYASKDPCNNVPKGHKEAMWRKHNQCE